MLNKVSLLDQKVAGQKVFVRVDFNVPLDKQQQITDDTRVRKSLKTIEYLVNEGARVILASHLGRPKGQVKPEFSLKPVAKRLQELLPDRTVKMAPDCIGTEVEAMVAELAHGEILLLENLRFHKAEEANDSVFAEQLASLAELYVNDAFGAAHRAHASTHGIASFLPTVPGFLMEQELKMLGSLLSEPIRPFWAVIGGAKISDKIGVIDTLIDQADGLIIGGGMANTFLKAQGYELGASLVEQEKTSEAKQLLEVAVAKGKKILLPVDVVVAEEVKAGTVTKVVPVDGIEGEWKALDIGPKTIESYATVLREAKTVFWNGPMGVFEIEDFRKGTEAVAKVLSEADATTVVGGGDSVAAIEQLGLADRISHISTGGGASLEFMEGKVLPGVEVLQDKA